VWLERGARPRPIWAIAIPAALAVALPLGRLFAEPSLLGNGWALLPFDRAGLTAARILLVAGAAAAVTLYVFAPRLAFAGVAVFLAGSTAVVYSTIRGQSRTVFALSGLSTRNWVDRTVRAPVTYLNATKYQPEHVEGRWFAQWAPVWETEFWNRDALDVLTFGATEPTPLFQELGSFDWRTGRILGGGARYVLADPRVTPVGKLLASSGRLKLYRAAEPLRLASAVEGVRADGTTPGLASFSSWTGRGTVLVRTNGPAKVAAGAFAPLADGGRLATTTVSRTVDGSTEFAAPSAPFRVEVRAAPGTRVAFGLRRA
jgi:hypothetical protein